MRCEVWGRWWWWYAGVRLSQAETAQQPHCSCPVASSPTSVLLSPRLTPDIKLDDRHEMSDLSAQLMTVKYHSLWWALDYNNKSLNTLHPHPLLGCYLTVGGDDKTFYKFRISYYRILHSLHIVQSELLQSLFGLVSSWYFIKYTIITANLFRLIVCLIWLCSSCWTTSCQNYEGELPAVSSHLYLLSSVSRQAP